MNGKTPEEWAKGRLSGPLTDKELAAYLKKVGKLPPNKEIARAA